MHGAIARKGVFKFNKRYRGLLRLADMRAFQGAFKTGGGTVAAGN